MQVKSLAACLGDSSRCHIRDYLLMHPTPSGSPHRRGWLRKGAQSHMLCCSSTHHCLPWMPGRSRCHCGVCARRQRRFVLSWRGPDSLHLALPVPADRLRWRWVADLLQSQRPHALLQYPLNEQHRRLSKPLPHHDATPWLHQHLSRRRLPAATLAAAGCCL